MSRNLKSVAQLAEAGVFSIDQLRWMIFNAESNGLQSAGAICRVGRRVYIDADAFDAWIVRNNPSMKKPAAPEKVKGGVNVDALSQRRGEIAALLMAGMLADHTTNGDMQEMARCAVRGADALIFELKKP